MTVILHLNIWGNDGVFKTPEDCAKFIKSLQAGNSPNKENESVNDEENEQDFHEAVIGYLANMKTHVTDDYRENYSEIIEKIINIDELNKKIAKSNGEFKTFNKYTVYQLVGFLRTVGFYDRSLKDVEIDKTLEGKASNYRPHIARPLGKGVEQAIEIFLRSLKNKIEENGSESAL